MRELTKEEGEALTKDLQEVLAKHGAELGVIANIQLLKREEDTNDQEILTTDNGDKAQESA